MTQQMDLFGAGSAAPAVLEHDGMLMRGPVRAARNGEVTSIEAAERHEGSGKAAAHRSQVFAGVLEWPGRTSRELAAQIGMDRHEVARRLPELERMGWVWKGDPRKCEIGGTTAYIWWSTPGTNRTEGQS